MKMCLHSGIGAGVAALSIFAWDRRIRIALPTIFMIFYLPFYADDFFLIIYYDITFVCCVLLMELLRKNAGFCSSRKSLIILIGSTVALLLIDFSMHSIRYGLVSTFVVGGSAYCLYRIFSIFLIAESVRLLNLFVKSPKVSALIVFNALFILSFINYWVYEITGKTFILSNLHLAGTAMGGTFGRPA